MNYNELIPEPAYIRFKETVTLFETKNVHLLFHSEFESFSTAL